MDKADPFIVVFDLDGTVIGEISPQLCEWELLSAYQPSRMKQYKEALHLQLIKSHIVRPDFVTFIDYLRHNYPYLEMYVYTASDDKWAKFIIAEIEAATGVAFNRPLFTRKHCIAVNGKDGQAVSYEKSVNKILPFIYRNIRAKYGKGAISLRQSKDKEKDNFLMVDNNNVLIGKEDRRLVHCPTYDHLYAYDVLRFIDEAVVRDNYHDIMRTLKMNEMFPNNADKNMSYEVFMTMFLQHIFQKSKRALKDFKPDKFWRNFSHALRKVSKNNPDLRNSHIKSINHFVNEGGEH